ncbi:protein amnionless-like [Aphidius gifuensis]|uniref:protein amnionless-like n=1 Tax=Aphidius gifuensis TaxID=684658 RepID=UPI001CDC3BE0|nr:protein amnionless-like [Aphidius gifuensis]
MHLIFLHCIILSFIKNTIAWRLGEELHWLPNLEWTTKNNWINENIPTLNSRILFPLEMKHSVGFPLTGKFILTGIDLPRDGSLLLPNDGSVKFSNSNDKKLIKNVSKWKWSGPFYWVDPNNWNNTNLAMPHFEKIPCSTDTIVLPDNKYSLSIKFPNENVKIKKIKIGSLFIGTNDWKLKMYGREFRDSHQSVKFSGLQYCPDEECLCRQDPESIDLLIGEICKIQSTRCSKKINSCDDPLKVEGHCCDYCGSKVLIDHKVSLVELEELSNVALKKYKDTLSWHARMTWDENMEVLIMENDEYTGIKNQEAMNILAEALTARGIAVMGKNFSGPPVGDSALSKSLITIFCIFLVSIIIVLIALPYFGWSYSELFLIVRDIFPLVRDGTQPVKDQSSETATFEFARFQNVADGDIQLASTAYDEDQENPNDNEPNENPHEGGKRFENPLYTSKKRRPIEELNIIDVNSTLRLTDLQKKIKNQTDCDSE